MCHPTGNFYYNAGEGGRAEATGDTANNGE